MRPVAVQVYSTSVLGEARVFNRVAKFSQNTRLIFMARDVDTALFTASYVRKVQAAFDERPALAMVVGTCLLPFHPRTCFLCQHRASALLSRAY